jgi:hypothetical protein
VYEISESDILEINEKLKYQKDFIENLVSLDNGIFSSIDDVYSANLNPKKYFAEVNNRVNTMVLNAKDKGLMPVFVTLTAPSEFHKKDDLGRLIKNPNEIAKELTQIWNKFTTIRIFRKMKKATGNGLQYFRVYEPHKSGVPHLHAMLFIPKNYILKVKKAYYNYFTDKNRWGNNRGSIDFKYLWKRKKGSKNGGAIAYMMKYIVKTFKNINKNLNKKIQYSAYWYVKHTIRRFLSSRSLASLFIYRKVRYYFRDKHKNDYLYVTEQVKKGHIYLSKDKTRIIYKYWDYKMNDVEYKDLWVKEPFGRYSGNFYTETKNKSFNSNFKAPEQDKLLNSNHIKANDNIEFKSNYSGLIQPFKLNNYELEKYYNKINGDFNINHHHFKVVHNEMIKRKIINANKYTLDKFDGSIFIDAGAGAGKTRRIIQQIDDLTYFGINPKEILVFSFTKKSVLDLEKKFITSNLIPNITTFHRFGYKFLKEHLGLIRDSNDFVFIDVSKQNEILQELFKNDILNIKKAISKFKNDYILSTQIINKKDSKISLHKESDKYFKVYQDYGYKCIFPFFRQPSLKLA